ncbi:hypothetical protein GQ44DRAFT_772807 [Phaeosphaeriaceae sp. PMI808]|nr:hypothetical protein GQ44DRAFT_772807 [Phaeosphaeriaceae sp. PMI808]
MSNDWTVENFYQRLNLSSYRGKLDWKGFCDFYAQCQWFKRAWAHQEVSFAEEINFRIGFHSFEFWILAGLPMFFDAADISPDLFLENGVELNVNSVTLLPWMRLKSLLDLNNDCHGIGSKSWLQFQIKDFDVPTEHVSLTFALSCIRRLRIAESTDARDRVFAALGYLKRSVPSGSSNFLEPDYNSTVKEVYTRAATMFATHTPDLAILSEVEDRSNRKLDRLPSWVPDFTVANKPILIQSKYIKYNATKIKGEKSLGMKTVRIQGRKLFLRGVMIGQISTVSDSPPNTQLKSSDD